MPQVPPLQHLHSLAYVRVTVTLAVTVTMTMIVIVSALISVLGELGCECWRDYIADDNSTSPGFG